MYHIEELDNQAKATLKRIGDIILSTDKSNSYRKEDRNFAYELPVGQRTLTTGSKARAMRSLMKACAEEVNYALASMQHVLNTYSHSYGQHPAINISIDFKNSKVTFSQFYYSKHQTKTIDLYDYAILCLIMSDKVSAGLNLRDNVMSDDSGAVIRTIGMLTQYINKHTSEERYQLARYLSAHSAHKTDFEKDRFVQVLRIHARYAHIKQTISEAIHNRQVGNNDVRARAYRYMDKTYLFQADSVSCEKDEGKYYLIIANGIRRERKHLEPILGAYSLLIGTHL